MIMLCKHTTELSFDPLRCFFCFCLSFATVSQYVFFVVSLHHVRLHCISAYRNESHCIESHYTAFYYIAVHSCFINRLRELLRWLSLLFPCTFMILFSLLMYLFVRGGEFNLFGP